MSNKIHWLWAALCVHGVATAHGPPVFPPAPTAHTGARVSLVATGLHDPRGMAISPRGELYVAEAGTTRGVFVPPPPPAPNEPPTRDRCEVYWPLGPITPGYTGRISRIDHFGRRSTVASGLPSFASNLLVGGDRGGASALAFRGNHLYAMLTGGGCSHGHPSEPNGLLRVFGDGTSVNVAGLGNYLRTTPDSKDPAAGDFEADGTWFNLVRAFGAFYAVEPNHGAFVRISNRGDITPVADMIAAVSEIAPDHDGDLTFAALTRHNGQFYVGVLGRIDTGFAASVYRVSRDGSNVKRVATGLHGVLGIAFDRQDRLYALETTRAGVDPPLSDPKAGRLVRVERNGSLTPIVSNLAFPTSLIAGRSGEFYLTQCGYHCDGADGASLKAGQILKVTVPGAHAWCDIDDED